MESPGNIAQRLKEAREFQEFVAHRGRELIIACGYKFWLKTEPESVIFNDNTVEVIFEEKTRHDSPDREWMVMDIAELSMSEDQWNEYLETKRQEVIAREKAKAEKEEAKKLADKEAQFEKLKQELGK